MTDVVGVDVEAIVALREEYRRQMNCQIVHDSWHQRGFTNSYLLRVDRETAGYGSIGGGPREARETVKEFFVRPAWRRRHLHRSRGRRTAPGSWQLSGAGVEADLPRKRSPSRRPLSRHQYRLTADAAACGSATVRTYRARPPRDLSALCQMRDCRPVKVPR